MRAPLKNNIRKRRSYSYNDTGCTAILEGCSSVGFLAGCRGIHRLLRVLVPTLSEQGELYVLVPGHHMGYRTPHCHSAAVQ